MPHSSRILAVFKHKEGARRLKGDVSSPLKVLILHGKVLLAPFYEQVIYVKETTVFAPDTFNFRMGYLYPAGFDAVTVNATRLCLSAMP